MRRIPVLLAIATVAFAPLAAAQPKDGDLVASVILGSTNVVYIDRTTGLMQSLTNAAHHAGSPNAVLMASNNDDMIVTDLAGTVAIVSRAGAVTTLATTGIGMQSGDMLQNGNYIVNTFTNLLEVDPLGNVTTLGPTIPSTNAIARDHDTDTILLAGTSTAGALLEYDPRTNAITTLCTFSGTMSGIDPMPRGWNGSRATAFSAFVPPLSVCSGNTIVRSITGPRGQSMKIDDATGNAYVVSTSGDVEEYDLTTGTRVNTWGPFSGQNFSGVELYRSRKIIGAGTGAAGTPYGITMNFGPAAANGAVLIGLSLGQRPGIPIPGVGQVNLAPDPLLVLSVQGLLNGTVLSGFPPTLDSLGRGGGTILIPGALPRGSTFYFSAVAIVQQSIVIPANTIGIRVP